MNTKNADIAVIGTGPAGISAAITAKIRNKTVLLFGSEPISFKVIKAHKILNYPGLPSVTGEMLAKQYIKQLDELNINIIQERVNAVYAMGSYFVIQTNDKQYCTDSVILASGMVTGKPLMGENEYLGRGVSYCATCDAQFYKGKKAAVIGYNKAAADEAEYLSEIAEKVIYFPMSKAEPKESEKIGICREKPLEITGNMKVERLKTDIAVHDVDGVFILREALFPKQLVPGLAVEGNHAAVNLQMETNIAGLFACGDITGTPYQYIKAAGQGNVAALSAAAYLTDKNKVRL